MLASYGDKPRHYHLIVHVYACLSHLDNVRHLALWFHDAIYVARKANNELESANWVKAFWWKMQRNQTLLRESLI